MSTLDVILLDRASRMPNAVAYRFLAGERIDELTYGELLRKARAVAGALGDVAAVGDRVLLVYPPGLDFIAAFLGCLLAGVIAVPVSPPVGRTSGRHLPTLLAIGRDAEPAAVLTVNAFASAVPAVVPIRVIATDALCDGAGRTLPAITPATIACLQYTSGSTGAPKGVVLTHGNLLASLAAIALCNPGDAHEGVSWLPHFHDMGLVGGILLPLYQGFAVSLLSPLDVLKQPVRWLEAISRYRATVSPAPPFALELCVRRVSAEQRARLELGHWRVAFVGSEPISPAVLDRFADAFAPCGFRREALVPCYGLAEATLLVSGSPPGAGPTVLDVDADALACGRVETASSGRVRRLVGSGRVAPGVDLVIADASGDQIGEICLRGAIASPGYWGQQPMQGYLRTGDLGFLRGDELFVCGRIKDVIIVRGRNHHPHDIEATVEHAHPAVRAGFVVAFPITRDHAEALAVIAELQPDASALIADIALSIQAAITQHHDLRAADIVLAPKGTLTKTTSGKLQRSAARTMYERGEVPRWP